MNQIDNKVLIIGKPGTSKTTFLAQLFNVLQGGNSRMKLLDGMPENIMAIDDARRRLAKGINTKPTPADDNKILQLKLLLDGNIFELEFPDYGGEQVRDIIHDRQLGRHWVRMSQASNQWILFIRLHDHAEPLDVLTKSIHEVELSSHQTDSQSTFPTKSINESVELIELLQMLLAVRNVGIRHRIKAPKLKTVITLWDELQTDLLPEEVLKNRYPLFMQYISSNWANDFYEVWGLSAQGFSLAIEENRDKYLDFGPQEYAYVVRPTGEHANDLSLLFD
ncbi:hypothetical protein GO755_04450 [Spirosoma sp. HMF4905]|uniref:Double-GTPase 1 domain-containing protein n=1 Tax=Spirosoma arboris TaxID=2682092 RepID=A0A7K1S624_9BACT|nr:hypothetical protein [Spirosoma arboris]MVM29272.1 hypothetical protein [Spirosoma arboris]